MIQRVTDPRKGTSITHYDAKGRVDWVADPAGHKTTLAYDEVTGRTIAQTDALGHVTRTGYDVKGQVIHVWGDATYPVSYEYDPYGRKVKMFTYRDTGVDFAAESWPADPGQGDVTTWNYDPESGLLTEKRDNANKGPLYTYTVDGKLLTRKWARKDAAGNDLVTTYSYDAATGELTGVDYSDSTPDVTFTYDRMGRQRQITDAAGTRAFAYNADFSLASEAITGIYNKVLSRSYDSTPGVKGRYAGFTVGAGYSVSYGYDEKGRMNQVSWNVNSVPGATDYSYVPGSDLLAGMSTARTDGAYTPVTASYTYEDKRDVKTQVLNRAGARVISQYDYRYNAIGNRTSVVNTGEAFAGREGFNLYGYNSRSEVTESRRFRGTSLDDTSRPVTPEYRSYNYDPIGNRKTAVDGNETSEAGKSTTYTTNGLNQYESTAVTPNNNESATFTYDADGNMTSVADSTGYTLYVFDGENRLIEVRPQSPVSGQKKVAFAYDFMGRRIRKDVYSWNNNAWSPTSSRTFTWDGWLMTDETVATNGGQPETTSYVWGLDLSQTLNGAGGVGGLLASVEGAKTYYFLYAYNVNVGQLVNAGDGSIAAHYEHDLYGNQTFSKGATAFSNPFRFSTKYFDTETGLSYYGHRYYSPVVGRWPQRDPLGEPIAVGQRKNAEQQSAKQLYVFVANSPTNAVDALGLEDYWIGGAADKSSFMGVSPTHIMRDKVLKPYGGMLPGKDLYYGYDEDDSVVAEIQQAHKTNPCDVINIVGHSYGGAAAIDIDKRLRGMGIKVNVLITLDPVSMLPRSNPGNFAIWVNAYQKQSYFDIIATIPWWGQLPAVISSALALFGRNHDRSDVIATLGGQLGSQSGAINIPLDYNHFAADKFFLKAIDRVPADIRNKTCIRP